MLLKIAVYRSRLPHLGELLLWHRRDQLVVKLKNSLEVVENILTGNCIKDKKFRFRLSESLWVYLTQVIEI